ncbi:MAG: hypothetical protein S4CHLAM7_15560 [Chlamydiae bacterium]|nr:hypothetical protein [Chlamydiota bacterium]
MIKTFLSLVVGAAIIGGGYYYANKSETVQNYISQKFDSGTFHTLEMRFTSDLIMETHKSELLVDANHSFLSPTLHFYPYLLMEVKYSSVENTTSEACILWSMDDGEMVTTTATWEMSHGFEDCINANVDRNDFKIINALASNHGTLSRKELGLAIHVEPDILDRWIDSCKRKKLVVQSGNDYRLHFQTPKLKLTPETALDHYLVTQPYKNALRQPKKYSRRQIERIANLAFENDFTIRNITEIFLPVYRIDVQNPDGSILTTYWNALNGKKFDKLHSIL